MTVYWLCPEQIFDGKTLFQDYAISVGDGRVLEIKPAHEIPSEQPRRYLKGTISPGFVDLQVNGGGGVLLNQHPSREGMLQIANAHRAFGTVAIMPTVITDCDEVIASAAQAAIEAEADRNIIGVHIEGPHISPTRRGTHSREYVRLLNQETMIAVEKLCAADVPVMLTLAPEIVSPQQIEDIVQLGAIVSLGHTDATSEQMRAGFEAGANCVTHLFNAMSPMLNRAPGAVGAAINSQAYAGIICDGHHVADEMVGLAIRARPVADRMFLVSDAMPTVGGEDHFNLYGRTIHLEEGKLVNAEGSLAGAHVTMAQSVRRLIATVGIDPQTALRMAVSVPAQVVGQDQLGQLQGRYIEDVILLDHDYGFVGFAEAQ